MNSFLKKAILLLQYIKKKQKNNEDNESFAALPKLFL